MKTIPVLVLCGCAFVLGFGDTNAVQREQTSGPGPAGHQWEYLFIKGDDNGFEGIQERDLDGDGKMDSYSIDSWNQLGKQGWELVTMDRGMATLKRPLK
ncbi:MAG: hypothetical protein VX438_09225 [Planctomycetota bacterium]|nr:hypothetical protein [Planctomycetota bacterium]